MAVRPIYILHENEEWLVPLRVEFAKRGVEANEWFIHEGQVELDSMPTDAVYYNRMSASSHTRGHRFAPELARMTLTWLEQHQATVVNDSRALYLEVCKVSQYRALRQAGVRVPRTVAVIGKTELVKAAEAFNQWPLILKPNRGGKGLGVARYDDLAALTRFIESNDYAEPLDGIWLVQEYVQPVKPFIQRAEFVGGEYIYTVQVSTAEGFELCPADVCAVGDDFCPTTAVPDKFTIVSDFDEAPLIGKLQHFMKSAGVDVAGIEFIETATGDLVAYDVNTNTNYNQTAEQKAGVAITGMGALADYLISLR